MNKYISSFAVWVICATLIGTVLSCKEDIVDPPIPPTPPTPPIIEEEVEKILNTAMTEWDVSTKKVIEHMDGYNIVNSIPNEFLLFSNDQNNNYISYKFKNDSLCSTLVLIPQISESDILAATLNGYTLIGEIDNKNIYQNKDKNTMLCHYDVEKDTTMYKAIGFTPINSKTIETLQPVIITTGEVNNIEKTSAYINCNISGVTLGNIKINYDTNSLLPASTRKVRSMVIRESGDFSIKLTGLKKETTYYYQIYLIINGAYYWGDIKSFTTK